MIVKPAKIPERTITPINLPKSDGGLFLGGDQIAPSNSFTEATDIELDNNGYPTPRRKLMKLLPNTVGVSYQKFPVLWGGELYYFTADNGKIKFCQSSDAGWTDCTGTNSFTTNNGGMTKFLRILDNVFILNGKNGDKLAYVNLSGVGFPVVKYTLVTNPSSPFPAPTLTGLSAGAFKIYYAFSYSGAVGETELSSITTVSINKSRDEWPTLATPGSITLVRPGAVPAGAKYWNVYVALAAADGAIQKENMLLLATQLDTGVTNFIDNGTLAVNLGSSPPLENGTDGPRVDQGIIANGNPVLYADQDNLYAVWIGGGGDNAMNFTESDGGYKAEPEKGTNYYPTSVIGFRNGQGIPSLTILYSNTEGLSKQAVLQQQTINYGESSFSVWGIVEQNYGAAGVAAPNSAINYNGRLAYLSTDGFATMETQPSIQNVLSTKPISAPIDPYVRAIKNSAMEKVVGTGWENKYMWLVPSYGFDEPQEILVLDTNSKGTNGDGAWYSMKIAANWIGVISPDDSAAFVYLSIGSRTYKLTETSTTFDTIDGVPVPFATKVVGPALPISGSAHNSWMAIVQGVFELMNVAGRIEVGIKYRNQEGKVKIKSKVYQGSVASPSSAGGWADPQWTYASFPQLLGWSAFPVISGSAASVDFENVRIKVSVDDIANEWQWYLITDPGYNSYTMRPVSIEGINLGVKPDLQ